MDEAVARKSVASGLESPFAVLNPHGRGRFVLVCEHASNRIPQSYRGLGLAAADLERHIAWDIGALALAGRLSGLLDAPLVHATYSRLLVDLNRAPEAPDSIVASSEDTPVPGNVALSADERALRHEKVYRPFHAEVERLLDQRCANGWNGALVSVHSFTPVYRGMARPWHTGVISQHERRLADRVLAWLRADPGLCVGDNEPYGPGEGAHHTMERHAERRGIECAALEVRNDLLRDGPGLDSWARRLRAALTGAS